MFIPVVDRIEYGGAQIGDEEKYAINRVIDSQGGKRWTIGPESELLEKELAETVGMKRAILTNSGSSALLVALTSLHLPKYSNVIIPALNFPTAFNAIIQNNLTPYVIDIDMKNLLLKQKEITSIIKKHDIAAVIAVNVASNPVDLIGLRDIVGPDCKIILDNCDGFGTTVNDRFVESYADLACTSFHAAHIITMGEGGAIFTNNEELADRCRKIREWGRASGTDKLYKYPGLPADYRERYVYEEIGYNVKPLELQCALGRVQLKRLKEFKFRRIANFNNLYERFKKYEPKIKLVDWMDNSSVCWFSFPFICDGVDRGKVMDSLEKNNIECRTIFSGNILRHPAYRNTYVEVDHPMVNADKVMSQGIFISVHPSITEEMIDFIDKVIGEAISK